MRFGKSVVLGAALVFASACGNTSAEETEYVEATPDLSGTALEINGETAAAEGAALLAATYAVHEAAEAGQPPEFLDNARVTVQALNGALRTAITPLVELANSGTMQEDTKVKEVRVFGPRDVGDANWRLLMRKGVGNRYQWKLEARAKGSTDEQAFKLVATGGLVKGAKAHRGRGTLSVNLDNYKAVVPASTAQGRLMASFAHTAGDDKSLAYRLKDFTPNPASVEPITGAFVGHRLLPSKATRVRLFGKYNLAASETAKKETVFTTVRYVPGLGGRADVLAMGGDLPAGKVYQGAACWDPQEKETFKVLRVCDKGTLNCTKLAEVGTREACPSDWRNDVEAPSDDVNNTQPEPGAPADAPEAVPADVTADF
ncbi:hypothetical protein P2318_27775 [Myxococcaceae bacterium GXIMD 01537]